MGQFAWGMDGAPLFLHGAQLLGREMHTVTRDESALKYLDVIDHNQNDNGKPEEITAPLVRTGRRPGRPLERAVRLHF